MLVISRRPGERICLGDNVVVTVLDVAGSSVRIGIEAPRELPIFRHEVWTAIQEENRAAAEASPQDLPPSPRQPSS
jgi:carbon storage regulator